MWDLVIGGLNKVLGGTTKEGENQFLKLFEGSERKQLEFKKYMEDAYFKKLELELKDRMDARGMQTAALKQDDTFSKRFLYYVTIGILFVTGLLALYPMFFEIPPGNEAMLTRATDFFYMIAGGSVIGFFFGTNNTIKKDE